MSLPLSTSSIREQGLSTNNISCPENTRSQAVPSLKAKKLPHRIQITEPVDLAVYTASLRKNWIGVVSVIKTRSLS